MAKSIKTEFKLGMRRGCCCTSRKAYSRNTRKST